MKPSTAFAANRSAIRASAIRFHSAYPRVFGSVAHGNDNDESDLDLLVDPLPGVTLFDLGGLQIALEEMLGVPVDLLTPGDLPKKSAIGCFRRRSRYEREPYPRVHRPHVGRCQTGLLIFICRGDEQGKLPRRPAYPTSRHP
jgi:predicted nucleotidyltransferase